MRLSKSGVIALVLTLGCGGQNTGSVQPMSRNPDVLTRAELLQSSQRSKDLYEAVRSLRPNFLNPLTTRTQGNSQRVLPKPAVFIDGTLAGELESLHGIMAENVEEVRFRGPTEAAGLGPSAAGGAILVMLYKGLKP